jgi:hypothetical protein
MRHPENSLFESVRISSDTADVILSGAFPREDLIFLIFLLSFNSFFILPLAPSSFKNPPRHVTSFLAMTGQDGWDSHVVR